jgi:hypothetical protein
MQNEGIRERFAASLPAWAPGEGHLAEVRRLAGLIGEYERDARLAAAVGDVARSGASLGYAARLRGRVSQYVAAILAAGGVA